MDWPLVAKCASARVGALTHRLAEFESYKDALFRRLQEGISILFLMGHTIR